MTPLVTLEEVLHLLRRSPLHCRLTLPEIIDWVYMPMYAQQYLVFRRETNGPLTGYLSYAMVNDEMHTRMIDGSAQLYTPEDWNSGPHLWITDFVAPYGDVRQIAGAARKWFAKRSIRPADVHWVRRYATAINEPRERIKGTWQSSFSRYSH